MSTPKSIEELTRHIEQAVGGYLAEGRKAAVAAMERAFSSAPNTVGRSSSTQRPKGKTRAAGARRSGKELAEVRAQLCELVCRQPGEAMVTFATELGMSVRELHRPMSVLKREGRVRTVGQRHLTRYFPTVDAVVSASA
jgi:DNA-binding NtrC family response regulator